MLKKTRKSIRTPVDSTVFFAWHHKETGERLGWVFASRKAAGLWRNQTYWRYYKYKSIDDYFKTIGTEHRRRFATRYWLRDRDFHTNYELRTGYLKYKLDKTKDIRAAHEFWKSSFEFKQWVEKSIHMYSENKVEVRFTWKGGEFNMGRFYDVEKAKQKLLEKLFHIGVFSYESKEGKVKE